MKSILTLFMFISLFTGPIMAKSEPQIYGYVEKATLTEHNLTLSAKLDTGAKSSSLNATHITEIQVKGEPYLRFNVPTKTGDFVFEGKYIGLVKIKARAGEHSSGAVKATAIHRPVVLLEVKLGDKTKAIKVNLTNRKRFLYPLLLGRDALIEFDGAVNPAVAFTLKPKSTASDEK